MTPSTRNLTVFGATGPTGTQIVRAALAAGHSVTAVAREPSRLEDSHDLLRVVQADVLDRSTLAPALRGADGVLSAVGSHPGRRPTTVYSDGVTNILEAMAECGVRRFVGISATPAASKDESGMAERLVVFPLLHLFFGGSHADMARMERILETSRSDWTAVRAPQLTDGPAKGGYRVAINGHLRRARKISRADLAAAMLQLLDDPGALRARVTVSY